MSSRLHRGTVTGILILLLCSCGARYHVKKGEKHFRIAESKGAHVLRDTVYRITEVFVPEIRVDSTIVIKPGDTVTIFQDRLQVKIKRLAGDTVFVDAKCLPDTIKVETISYVNNEITCPDPRWSGWDILKVGSIALILGYVLGRLALRYL